MCVPHSPVSRPTAPISPLIVDLDDVERSLGILFKPGEVFEVRFLKCKPVAATHRGGWAFNDPASAARRVDDTVPAPSPKQIAAQGVLRRAGSRRDGENTDRTTTHCGRATSKVGSTDRAEKTMPATESHVSLGAQAVRSPSQGRVASTTDRSRLSTYDISTDLVRVRVCQQGTRSVVLTSPEGSHRAARLPPCL